AVVDGGDVDVDDVARLEHPVARDAVAHHLVHRGAHALREAVVVERRGEAAAAHGVVVHEAVDLLGRDAGADHLPHAEQRLGGPLGGHPDAVDLLRRFDAHVAHDPCSSLSATASFTAAATSAVSAERCQWT